MYEKTECSSLCRMEAPFGRETEGRHLGCMRQFSHTGHERDCKGRWEAWLSRCKVKTNRMKGDTYGQFY